MSVPLKGTFFVMQQGARNVTAGGRIIVISPPQALNAETEAAIYASSKSAGKKQVGILAKELDHRRITVKSVNPEVIDHASTDMKVDLLCHGKVIKILCCNCFRLDAVKTIIYIS